MGLLDLSIILEEMGRFFCQVLSFQQSFVV
jgi:hypothetical protein